jgi:hypothetical protein
MSNRYHLQEGQRGDMRLLTHRQDFHPRSFRERAGVRVSVSEPSPLALTCTPSIRRDETIWIHSISSLCFCLGLLNEKEARYLRCDGVLLGSRLESWFSEEVADRR